MGLDVARRSPKTDRALVQMAVDTDMSELPALEAGFMIVRVVMGKGCVMVSASLPDFSVSHSGFFLFSQRG